MALIKVNPCSINYTPKSSGDVGTGEIQTVRGGGRLATVYSGILTGASVAAAPGAVAAGDAVYFFSGAGRLNWAQSVVGLLSGQAVTFYDTAVAASGGPIPTSGHKVLGRLPGTQESAITILSGSFGPVGVFNFDAPFQSGLAAKVPSGCPAFSISWTPEVSAAFTNP